MNTFASINGPLAESLGWTLLHHLWQATVLALIAAASLRLMSRRSANARYLVSCGFLLILAVFPIATAVRLYESPLPLGAPLARPASVVRFVPTGEAVLISAQSQAGSPMWLDRAQRVAEPVLPWIVALWLVGVAVLSLRLFVGWAKTRRLAAAGQRVSELLDRTVARIAASLNVSRTVRLLQSAQIDVPMVIGWLRPVVLVPTSALTGLTPQQLESIFAHELAHIRRHDYLVNLLQTFAETLFFYHPAVWWMSSRIRIERENCCDDLAVSVCGNPLLYARALTNLEGLRSESVAVAANGGSLRSRVLRLVGMSPAQCSYRWMAGASILTFVAAIAIGGPVAAFFGEEPDPWKPQPQSEKPVAAPTVKVVEEAVAWPKQDVDTPTLAEEVLGDEQEAIEQILPSDPESILDDDKGQKNFFETSIPGSEIQFSGAPGFLINSDGLITVNPQVLVREYNVPVLQVAMLGEKEHTRPPATPAPPTPPPSRRRWNGELTVDQLIALRAAGVDAQYVRALRRLGYGELAFEDLLELRTQGIDAVFIAHMNDVGLGHVAAADLIALRNAGVTPDYIDELREAGFEVDSARALVTAKAGGISGAYIAALRDVGMSDLSIDDIIRLYQSGVDVEFIRELKQEHEE